MPRESYHQITLAERAAVLDPGLVPAGRQDVPETPLKPIPALGTVPPELLAEEWVNADTPPSLSDLRGQVVLIDFWTSTCGTCISLIPHLNEMQEKYGPRGLRVIGFTHQSKRGVEWFMEARQQPIHYAVGAGSDLKVEYGVKSVPYAFVVGRDGTLLWHGSPSTGVLDSVVVTALSAQ
jgi:thiol-disulfide isomerase/thioredoxin